MRLAIRTSALAGAILSCGLIACGGDDDGEGPEAIDPNGTNHTYVVSGLTLPTNGSQATALGLDIDGKPNDGVDNQLGSVLGSIGALAPSLDLQATLTEQIDQGKLVLLTNVKATDLASARGVGLYIYLGKSDVASVMPAACTDTTDTVCRKHLAGTGMFAVDTAGPTDAALGGRIISGTFTGGPGEVTLQISLAGGLPIALPLKMGKAEVHGITADGWAATGSKIGGAVLKTDIDTMVIPAIGDTLRTTFDRDCDVGGTPPSCNCAANSTGLQMKNLFDKTPNDCNITNEEVKAVVSGFLTPDIDVDKDGTNDALSLGIGVTAVKGGFTVP